VADRTSESDRRLDREPPRGPTFTGMQHWSTRIRTAPARAGAPWRLAGAHLPHPHPLDHVFQMTGFIGEYSGLRVDFWYSGTQKTPRSPNPPEHGHRKTLVPHGTHSDLPRRTMTAHDHHDRHLARGCLTAPGAACGQPRRSQLDHRFDREPPAGGDVVLRRFVLLAQARLKLRLTRISALVASRPNPSTAGWPSVGRYPRWFCYRLAPEQTRR
jgi:hypothetical protein